MSWLYTVLLAGLMFSTESSNVPVQKNYLKTEATTKRVIKLDESERFEQSYPLNANGRVAVSNVNGSITIDTWDRNEVRLVAVKTSDDKQRLSDVEIVVDARPDSFSVETDYDNWRDRSGQGKRNFGRLTVEYTLTVPRGAVLNEIETVNGSVKISNATNTVRASAVNGSVSATNLRGATSLSSVNGTINADFDQLQPASRISLETVNGTVNLTIPSDANATLRAESLNGTITNDFGLPVRKGQYVGRDLYGKVGTGDVQIKLESVNGELSIKRKNDGKGTNPAVNLLPQKSEDDDDNEDWDEDANAKMSSEQLKEMAEAQKEAQKELKKAQKELNKLKPEIDKATEEALRDLEDLPVDIDIDLSSEVNTADVQAKLKDLQKKMPNVTYFPANAEMPVVEKKSETFPVKGTPKVTVEAPECNVTVRGWDQNEVKYSVTRISKSRSQKPFQSSATHKDSNVVIKVAGNPALYNNNNADRILLEVYVPKKSNLKIVSNREIRLEGVSGELDVTGQEGAINVRDVDGKLRVASSSGKVRVIGFRGEIEAKTGDGELALEGDFQKINAQTADGMIVLTLPENASATIESNRNAIEAEGLRLEEIGAGSGKNVSRWKIGSGDKNYKLYSTADGEIYIRSANALRAS